MKKNRVKSTLLCIPIFLLTLTLQGCFININGCCQDNKFEFKRTEEHTISADGITALDIDTFFGSVTVKGDDINYINITADVKAGAPTVEEAQQITEQTEIKIEPVNGTLRIFIKKPKMADSRSLGVSFNITMPKSVAAKLKSSFGSVKVTDLAADVKADTSFASIECSNIKGSLDLETSYGSIDCKDIKSEKLKAHTSFASISCRDVTGRVDLQTSYGSIDCDNLITEKIDAHSSFGNIDINCSDQSPANLAADVSTSYGGIDFDVPAAFAGAVKADTSFGSIKTRLPITVSGEIGKDSLSGTVGTGKGELKLKTSFGSINIK
jgi:DUF4097 and DUF4098 domain-containing protein YvlB